MQSRIKRDLKTDGRGVLRSIFIQHTLGECLLQGRHCCRHWGLRNAQSPAFMRSSFQERERQETCKTGKICTLQRTSLLLA